MENGTAGWGGSPPPAALPAAPPPWVVPAVPDPWKVPAGPPPPEDPAAPPEDPAPPPVIEGAPRAVAGSGPRAAASHRQLPARKLRGAGPQAPDPDDAGPGRRSRGRSTTVLCAILAVQAVLSLRLVWSNTASQDEATALWAGHLMWSHWLHGLTIPPFQAYLPGAPIIYPPLAALADHLASLAGARLLSLTMMLGVTALLWSTAARLFGRPAAVFGAALFAILGPVLLLGALATGDALSLLLLAVSTWCVVRAGSREDATGWMILSGITLVPANAAAYSSVLFDPVVILLALLVAYPKPGGKAALARGATILTIVATLLMVGTLIGGDYYVSGIDQTLSLGVNIPSTRLTVLEHATAWTGIVAVAALCAAAVGWADGDRRRARMAALLAVAGLIGFGHEMNAPWYSWGYGHVRPAVFIASWRHIVDIFHSEGADNVTWLWTINQDRPGTGPIASWWPGAKYVTWVGIDGYYFRPSDTFATVFGSTIGQVRALTAKPILLSETAVGPRAGQFTKISDLFSGMRRYRTLGLVWFDKVQNDGIYHQDWRIENDPQADAAFRLGLSELNLVHP